eukprot:TRINITY_DN4271_c0_g1_i1.p2 TRINITY_DN4271_c0_g1~~TRINITY_DN4271_c0_g1_i1.p2  ORF type:complete len:149 (-),score=17.09 TRINITY_DN4271_c0_g1_i1:383-829(-)
MLRSSSALAQLRERLVPEIMPKERFWRIYFLVLQRRFLRLGLSPTLIASEDDSPRTTRLELRERVSCPITRDVSCRHGVCAHEVQVMQEPVLTSDGFTYECQAIIAWTRQHPTSPMTREPLDMAGKLPLMSEDLEAKRMIALYHRLDP